MFFSARSSAFTPQGSVAGPVIPGYRKVAAAENKKSRCQTRFPIEEAFRNGAALVGQTQHSSSFAATVAWTADFPQADPPELTGITQGMWFLMIKRHVTWNETRGDYMLGAEDKNRNKEKCVRQFNQEHW